MSRTRARDSSRAVWTSWLDLSAPVLLDSQVETSARVPISLQIDRYSDVSNRFYLLTNVGLFTSHELN